MLVSRSLGALGERYGVNKRKRNILNRLLIFKLMIVMIHDNDF